MEKNISPSGKARDVFNVTANGKFSYQWNSKQVSLVVTRSI
jgi:hypothetical protein